MMFDDVRAGRCTHDNASAHFGVEISSLTARMAKSSVHLSGSGFWGPAASSAAPLPSRWAFDFGSAFLLAGWKSSSSSSSSSLSSSSSSESSAAGQRSVSILRLNVMSSVGKWIGGRTPLDFK